MFEIAKKFYINNNKINMEPTYPRKLLLLNFYEVPVNVFVSASSSVSSSSSAIDAASSTTSSVSVASSSSNGAIGTSVSWEPTQRSDVSIPRMRNTSMYSYSTVGSGSGDSGSNNNISFSESVLSKNKEYQALKGYYFMPNESFNKRTGIGVQMTIREPQKLTQEYLLHNLFQIIKLCQQVREESKDLFTGTIVMHSDYHGYNISIPPNLEITEDAIDDLRQILYNLGVDFDTTQINFISPNKRLKQDKNDRSLMLSVRVKYYYFQMLGEIYQTNVPWILSLYSKMIKAKNRLNLLQILTEHSRTNANFIFRSAFLQNQYDIDLTSEKSVLLERLTQSELYLRYRLGITLLKTDPVQQYLKIFFRNNGYSTHWILNPKYSLNDGIIIQSNKKSPTFFLDRRFNIAWRLRDDDPLEKSSVLDIQSCFIVRYDAQINQGNFIKASLQPRHYANTFYYNISDPKTLPINPERFQSNDINILKNILWLSKETRKLLFFL